MKRLFGAVLILVLVLSLSCALGELGQTFETKHYTLSIPDGWTVDKDDLNSKPGSWELGYAYAPEDDAMCIRATLDFYDSWDGISLWSADEDEMNEYRQAMMEDYAQYAPVLIDILYVGRIPFFVMRLTDDGEVFYWAETMTNGYVVGLECYALDKKGDYRDVTDAERDLFIDILRTFEPKTK